MTRVPLVLDTTRPISSNHDSALIAAYIEEGVPVMIHEAGRYPNVLLPDGTSTRDEPHICITIGGMRSNGHRTWFGVGVSAFGRYVGSSRRVLHVYGHGDVNQPFDTYDPLVAEGEAQLAKARTVLAGMDAAYDAAAERMRCLALYPKRLSREAYEAACLACGVQASSDWQCHGWGWFSFPDYSADDVVTFSLMQYRAWEIEDQKKAAHEAKMAEARGRPRPTPARSGQLWEDCERCGKEPIYMPLMLCDDCWPKGDAAA